jgi:hypothetical protein
VPDKHFRFPLEEHTNPGHQRGFNTLFERRKDHQGFTRAIHANTSAIEDKLVVGTHLVDKKKWDPVLGCMTSDDVVSKFLFAPMEGGSSDINYQARTLFSHQLNRIMGVTAAVPQSWVVPGIFANGYAQGGVLKFHRRVLGPWIEVSGFVKYIIRGQQGFVLRENESALIQ